jgi:hypothetical protein
VHFSGIASEIDSIEILMKPLFDLFIAPSRQSTRRSGFRFWRSRPPEIVDGRNRLTSEIERQTLDLARSRQR